MFALKPQWSKCKTILIFNIGLYKLGTQSQDSWYKFNSHHNFKMKNAEYHIFMFKIYLFFFHIQFCYFYTYTC